MEDAALARYADLVVGFGANVQRGQIVSVSADLAQAPIARALAAAAYRAGAKFVDAVYFDPWVKRARIEHAATETLGFVPPWYGQRMLALGEHRCARISLSGASAPDALRGVDPERAGRDQLPMVAELFRVINDRTTNWTGAPGPTQAWAELVFPDVPAEDALARLWEQILHVCRLDEPDPIRAWRDRLGRLTAVAARLTELHLDSLRFEGPGTDLTVGLLPSSAWIAAGGTTIDGIDHRPNIPTEEVFTTPDPERTTGVVHATKPLVFRDGTIVRDLVVRFEGGRAAQIDASAGAEVLRRRCAADSGAARLGEVALVDGQGRIGPLGTVFYDTLLDENAASHIAFGSGFDFVLSDEDHARRNESSIHLDFMVGSDEVRVTGRTPDGAVIPILTRGEWQLG